MDERKRNILIIAATTAAVVLMVVANIAFILMHPSGTENRNKLAASDVKAETSTSTPAARRQKPLEVCEKLAPKAAATYTSKAADRDRLIKRYFASDAQGLNIPIAGLAKDGKHRTSELLYGYPPQTIGLKQHTPLFRLLTQIQDEVHRFAITFHRDKRSNRQIASALDEIKGIGEKTKSTLLKEFKSVKRIREASAEELAAVVGEAKAKIIQTYFSEK